MRSQLGSLAGKKVVIVGDILHSRVARSNVWTLLAEGANIVLAGPATLLPRTLATNGACAEKMAPAASPLTSTGRLKAPMS